MVAPSPLRMQAAQSNGKRPKMATLASLAVSFDSTAVGGGRILVLLHAGLVKAFILWLWWVASVCLVFKCFTSVGCDHLPVHAIVTLALPSREPASVLVHLCLYC